MDKRRGRIDPSVRADGHPAVEELVAYHRDELAGEARERLQDHLVLCKECARLLLDLENLVGLEPPSEAHRLSDDDVEEAKAALKARIRGETASPARLLRFHSSPPPKKG